MATGEITHIMTRTIIDTPQTTTLTNLKITRMSMKSMATVTLSCRLIIRKTLIRLNQISNNKSRRAKINSRVVSKQPPRFKSLTKIKRNIKAPAQAQTSFRQSQTWHQWRKMLLIIQIQKRRVKVNRILGMLLLLKSVQNNPNKLRRRNSSSKELRVSSQTTGLCHPTPT